MATTTIPTSTAHTTPRLLNIITWAFQIPLAALFAMTGFSKLTMPLERLAERIIWIPAVPSWGVRLIGFFEFLGALGLILPSVTRVMPKLSVVAAVGLMVVMASASIFHYRRGELEMITANIILGAIAAFVAWSRMFGAKIPPYVITAPDRPTTH